MKNFRCIYIIESFTDDGELVMRRFALNKSTAEKIKKQCKNGVPFFRKAAKNEHECIDPADVEG